MKKWYLLYTRSNWEKKVDRQLKTMSIESFCPLIKKSTRWADRMKIIEVPLFTSYVFVHITLKEELVVHRIAGVLNFVQYCGKPVIVNENVISAIKEYLSTYTNMEVIDIKNLPVGTRAKIYEGAFYNQEGEIVGFEGKKVLMIIETLGCVLTTKISVDQIKIIN